MANERADIVEQDFSRIPVTSENVHEFINGEMTPYLREVRARLNGFVRNPQIPIFDSSPITDADFASYPTDEDPIDGQVAFSSADNKLYIRVSGSWLASAAFS